MLQDTLVTHILEIRAWSAQPIWRIWVTYCLHKKHCQPCIINWDYINSHPDPWKWHNTIPNYIFNVEHSLRIGTVISVTCLSLYPFNKCTHRFKAILTLNSVFPLCTAKSINATTSSFRAAAVSSMRPLQRLSFMCISAQQVINMQAQNIGWNLTF